MEATNAPKQNTCICDSHDSLFIAKSESGLEMPQIFWKHNPKIQLLNLRTQGSCAEF
jgi:hypothetical protein